MDRHGALRRTTTWLAGVGLLVAALTGCASNPPTASSTSSASSSPTPTPTPPAPAPKVGQCHRMGLTAATRPVDLTDAVPCSQPHTTTTFFVGRLDRVRDGHLVAVDSATVQQQLNDSCRGRLAEFLGGDSQTRRLSRFEVVWFRPPVAEADRGADWYRCDAVAVADASRLASLPTKLKGVLDAGNALDRFGTCGTTDPSAKSFERVLCSAKHSWRAVSVIDLPADVAYLDSAAGTSADESCKNTASDQSNGALKFTWSFEWPSRTAWDDGQRYGYCWLPRTG